LESKVSKFPNEITALKSSKVSFELEIKNSNIIWQTLEKELQSTQQKLAFQISLSNTNIQRKKKKWKNNLLLCWSYCFLLRVYIFTVLFLTTSDYNLKSETQLPVRWCAPEVLLRTKFTLETDRYAFGVTLFELFSRGGKPYPLMSNAEILEAANKSDWPKLKLEKPVNCPSAIHDLMLRLTNPTEPKKRPSMDEVFDFLHALVTELEGKDKKTS